MFSRGRDIVVELLPSDILLRRVGVDGDGVVVVVVVVVVVAVAVAVDDDDSDAQSIIAPELPQRFD